MAYLKKERFCTELLQETRLNDQEHSKLLQERGFFFSSFTSRSRGGAKTVFICQSTDVIKDTLFIHEGDFVWGRSCFNECLQVNGLVNALCKVKTVSRGQTKIVDFKQFN